MDTTARRDPHVEKALHQPSAEGTLKHSSDNQGVGAGNEE